MSLELLDFLKILFELVCGRRVRGPLYGEVARFER